MTKAASMLGFTTNILFVLAGVLLLTGPAAASTFGQQTRIGFTSGDQWEPSTAADQYRHVYVLYPQYNGVPRLHDVPKSDDDPGH
jgi:hypothetical protein